MEDWIQGFNQFNDNSTGILPMENGGKVYKLGNENLLAPGAFQSSLSMDLSQDLSLSIYNNKKIYTYVQGHSACKIIQGYLQKVSLSKDL